MFTKFVKSIFFIVVFAFSLLPDRFAYAVQGETPPRDTISFDAGWRFKAQDVTGAEQPNFRDDDWRKIDVPHDWSIEGPYNLSNSTARGGGYLPAGIGWYRKTFTVSAQKDRPSAWIEFDGVMAGSDVWLNGHHLGRRPYGYVSFWYDLSPFLLTGNGQKNVIAVRADNSVQPASRYYTGAGIYRHVRLIRTGDVYVKPWGVYARATEVSEKKASVAVVTEIQNASKVKGSVRVESALYDPSGKEVARTEASQIVGAGKSASFTGQLTVSDPVRWDIARPALYKLVTRVLNADKKEDECSTTFGIREAHFEAPTGFWLNGKNIKIKGVCLHHDAGALGAAVPRAAWLKRLNLLKKIGVNAIRTSHNPVAPEFLDLCDENGFLVMDENFDTWTAKKANGENGYNRFFTEWWERDTHDMVVRDRNHPSVIIYSVGNEIHDNLNDSAGFKKYHDQESLIHRLAPGTPVTMALFRPAQSKVYVNGFADRMDVVGQNYRENELVAAHLAKPERKVLGTENSHTLVAWLAMRDHPFVAGEFLWTGIDYLGEADWPAITNGQGLFDRSLRFRPTAFQRQSWWSEAPVVHVVRKKENAGAGPWVADWTPNDFDTYDDAKLQVYSNCDEVELFLNGRSLGKQARPADDSPRAFETAFEKGELKAVGRNACKEVTSETLTTAGKPFRLVVVPDQERLRASFDEACYAAVKVVDAKGVLCPGASPLVKFVLSGPGAIAGLDNGDLENHESYHGNTRHAFEGECLVIIKAVANTGQIKMTASSEGLQPASITISAGR